MPSCRECLTVCTWEGVTEMNGSLPMPVKGRPYEHQQRAFDFACGLFGLVPSAVRSSGFALLAEMGCGKTYITIALMGILYQFGQVNRILIVAPLSLLGVWEEEIAKFADYPANVTVLKGTADKKRQLLAGIPKNGLQVVVVNYESARVLEKELLTYGAEMVVADEGHKLKENRSKQSKTMHNLGDRAKFKCLLTGTLITNKEIDVFSQYRFVDKNIFGSSFYSFRNTYFDMGGYGQYTPIFRKYRTQEFLERMHRIAFRVTKAECLDLPGITEEVRKVELEPKAMKFYKDIEKESFAQLDVGEVSAPNVLTKLLRLSQATGGHITNDDGMVETVSKAKLEALEDIVDSCIEEGKKLVIMARFVPELDDIEELLNRKHISHAVIRGGTKNRDEEIRRFQNDDACKVFVGNIAAAGLGITLTASSTMVFYSLSYNMSDFEQAKARIHRVSQREDCHYIYLVAKGTVDLKILKALRDKVDLAKVLIDEYRNGKNPFSD